MNARILLPAIPILACLAIAAPAGAATEPETASENWAGYVAGTSDSSGFSAVSSSWTEPAATCTDGDSTYAAFWVGLGGDSSQSDALEQAGTQADCTASGSPYYYAWYELVPSAPVKLDLKISAGDSVSSRVSVKGDDVTISFADRTTGKSVTKTVVMTDATPDTSSAEWITEAPSECSSDLEQCTPLPLADFKSVTFQNASATADGHTGAISAWKTEAVELSPSDTGGFLGGGGGYGYGGYGGYGAAESSYDESSGGASPSSLKSKGTSFTVTYGSNTSSSSTGSGYGENPYGGGGYGYGGYGYGGYGYGYGGYSSYGSSISGYGGYSSYGPSISGYGGYSSYGPSISGYGY